MTDAQRDTGDVVDTRRRRLAVRLRRVVGPRSAGDGPARPTATAAVVPLPRRRPEPPRIPYDIPATAGFIGRLELLDRLVGAPDGLLRHQRVVVLAGARGVGTSWLLCRAGHDAWEGGVLRDGRVHVDLRSEPDGLTARQAMTAMAERAGLGELDPTGTDAEAANHLRQLLSGRRILFLLDNVDRPDQLAPILAAQCHALVAGGPALRDLPGATVVPVPRLPHRDAVGLCSQAHPRRHREPRDDYERAMATIARQFAAQPKVLHELGGWGDRRRAPAAELALGLQRMLDAPPYVAVDRPDAIDAACQHHTAYAGLSEPARHLARLLSMVTDPLPPSALAVLAPRPRRRRGDDRPTPLEELGTAGFLEWRGDDVRLSPGLARLCRLHLHRDEPVRRRARAYVRLLRHLAREATQRAERLATDGRTPGERAAARSADEWFSRHRRLLHHLVATPAVHHSGDSGRWRRTARITGARWASGGQIEVAVPRSRRARGAWCELARSLQAWYERRGHQRRGRALCRTVRSVAAAFRLHLVEGWAANRLGAIALQRGDHAGAIDELAGAGRGWGRPERAQALTNRGVARLHLDDVDGALADLQAARRLRSRHDRVGAGLTDLNLGEAWHRHGRPDRAHAHLVAAADALEDVDDHGHAAALGNLVLVDAALGRLPDAVRAAGEAGRIYRRLGDTAGAVGVRLNTAVALLAFEPPRPEAADSLLTDLITELADRPPSPLLARVLLHAGDAARLRQRPATARLLWSRALDVAHQSADPDTAATAAHRLAP